MSNIKDKKETEGKKKRHYLSPEKKFQLFLETQRGETPIGEILRREGIYSQIRINMIGKIRVQIISCLTLCIFIHIICLLSSCGEPNQNNSTEENAKIEIMTSENLDSMIAKAAPLIEDITGLKFKSKIEYKMMDRDTYKDILLKKYITGLGKDLEAQAKDMEIEKARLNSRKRSKYCIGKYFNENNTLIIIPDNIDEIKNIFHINVADLEDFVFITIAHEMVNAIKDQNYAMEKLWSETKDEEERYALEAVIGGDSAYVTKKLVNRLKIADSVYSKSLKLSLFILGEPSIFEQENYNLYYIKGAEFIRTMIKEKGGDGYNLVFSSPPVSIRQIWFPNEYFYPNTSEVIDTKLLLEHVSSDLPFKGTKFFIRNSGMMNLRYMFLSNASIDKDDAIEVSENQLSGARYISYTKGGKSEILSITVHCFNKYETSLKYDEIINKFQLKNGDITTDSSTLIKDHELKLEGFNFIKFSQHKYIAADQYINTINVVGITEGFHISIFLYDFKDAIEKDFLDILSRFYTEILKMKKQK